MPDIEALYKKIGAKPALKKPDGSPYYALPIIEDSPTGAVVSESALIAEYLDAAYPDTPKLFPPGTVPLQHAFIDMQMDILANLWPFTVYQSYTVLNPRSEAHYRRSMEAYFVSKIEDLVPPEGEERDALWAKARTGFEKVDAWYQKGKDEGPYLLGKTICFADFVFAAFASWPKRIWGEDSVQWQDMKTWGEGRLGALVDSFAKYESSLGDC